MNLEERIAVLKNVQGVDEVISFNDSDGSGCDAIKKCLNKYEKIIFANGGDRNITNSPELDEYSNNSRVEFIFGVGGSNKINSSSWILDRYNNYLTKTKNYDKPWGNFSTLISKNGYKVKEILVRPNEMLSLQYHKRRSEYWIIVSGKGKVILEDKESEALVNDVIYIPVGAKHRVFNHGDEPLVFIEVSLGDYIEEDDIVRLEDKYKRV
jgi:mannose-6-phosphate isomerase-like protein (cupin superfamily)